jgi:hypothetical protein
MRDTYTRLKAWSDSRGITEQEIAIDGIVWSNVATQVNKLHNELASQGVSGYILNKLEELEEYCDGMVLEEENSYVDAIADSMVFDATELCKMGYNVELVVDEVLKVVESRTGAWDDKLGKFVKDKSPEAMRRWYEPNYVKNCKCTNPKTYISSLFDRKS